MMEIRSESETFIRLFALTICIGSIVTGYCSVSVSQMAYLYKLKKGVSTEQMIYDITLITSMLNLGNIIGPRFYKHLQTQFKLRKTLIITDACTIIALSIQSFQMHVTYLVVGRFIQGLFMGISATAMPLYLRGIAPKHIAGKLGAYSQLMITTGVLLCYLTGFIIDDEHMHDQIRWRIYLALPIPIIALRMLLLSTVFAYGTVQEQISCSSMRLLKKMYRDPERVLELYQGELVKDDGVTKGRSYNQRFRIAVVLMVANQATAINTVMFYTKQIFNKLTNNNPLHTQILMIFLALNQIISTYFATHSIEKHGRCQLILFGQFRVIVILLLLFFVGFWTVLEWFGDLLTIILVFMLIIMHNWSLGTACIVYCADILDDLTWVIIVLKVCSFVVAMTSKYMIEYFRVGNIFLLYAAISTICYSYLKSRLKETKGLSKLQIEHLFDSTVTKEDKNRNNKTA